MQPKVSVIVPIYKIPETLLRNCIESVMRQSLSDIEIILINDGNMDNIPLICDEYATKDKRVVVINQTNQGVSVARNAGIDISQSPFIAFVDADDWIEDKTLEFAYNAQTITDSDVVCWGLTVDSYKKQNDESNVYSIEDSIIFETSESLQELQRAVLSGRGSMSKIIQGGPVCKLYKRSIIDKYELRFKPELIRSQDNEFNFLYFEYVKKVGYLPHRFYHYIQYEESAMRGYKKNAKEVFQTFLSVVKQDIITLKKSELFFEDYQYLTVSKFADICRICYAHPNSPLSKQENVQRIKTLSEVSPFSEAINSIVISELEKMLKLVVPLLRMRLYTVVYYLFKLRYYIKNQ